MVKLVKANVVLSWLSLKSRECSGAKPLLNTSENAAVMNPSMLSPRLEALLSL